MNYHFYSTNDKAFRSNVYLKIYEENVEITFFRRLDQENEQDIQEAEYKKFSIVDGDILHSSLQGTEIRILGTSNLKLNGITTRQEWKDASIWSVLINDNYDFITTFNKVAESLPSRRSSNITANLFQTFYPIDFVVSHKSVSFLEMSWFVYTSPGFYVLSNVNFETIDDISVCNVYKQQELPKLKIISPSTIKYNEVSQFDIEVYYKDKLFDKPIEVFIRNINGYLPKTKEIITGKASFPVYAFLLKSGDTITIKADFRFVVTSDEVTIEVIE